LIRDASETRFDPWGSYENKDSSEKYQEVTEEEIKEILEELPFAFNLSEVCQVNVINTDLMALHFVERCYNFNKKLKAVRHHIK